MAKANSIFEAKVTGYGIRVMNTGFKTGSTTKKFMVHALANVSAEAANVATMANGRTNGSTVIQTLTDIKNRGE